MRSNTAVKQVDAAYDYVIIGAGSAGCVLANRLSANPDCRVLLIEAGGNNASVFINMPSALSIPMNNPRFNWGYHTEPEANLDDRRLHCPRGRGLGGSSAINGMVYVRGHPRDFDGWLARGADGWGYTDVLPYFKRAEGCVDADADTAYRGVDGPLTTTSGKLRNPLYGAFLAAAEQAGHVISPDLNGRRQEGFGKLPMTVRDGRRCSAALAYLDPIRTRPNLKVVTDALVEWVDIQHRRAFGVIWQHQGTRQATRALEEVIVCAGAIESPCILQRSGIGDPELLRPLSVRMWADLPGVGANLMDHLEVYVQQTCKQPVSLHRWLNLPGKAWIGARWLVDQAGLGATNHFEVGGFTKSGPDVPWPDIQFHFLPAAMSYDGRAVAGEHGYQVHVGPMLPQSRGSVRITDADSAASPRIHFNYLTATADRQVFRAAIRQAREIFAQAAFAPYRKGELNPGEHVKTDSALDAFVRRTAQSAYHPCGTCRMGADAAAVVDTQGRVHGVDGLRVADASIFPMITNGNLNAPTIMAAEKIAADITGDVMPAESPRIFEGCDRAS